jgi:hypothetical protein
MRAAQHSSEDQCACAAAADDDDDVRCFSELMLQVKKLSTYKLVKLGRVFDDRN